MVMVVFNGTAVPRLSIYSVWNRIFYRVRRGKITVIWYIPPWTELRGPFRHYQEIPKDSYISVQSLLQVNLNIQQQYNDDDRYRKKFTKANNACCVCIYVQKEVLRVRSFRKRSFVGWLCFVFDPAVVCSPTKAGTCRSRSELVERHRGYRHSMYFRWKLAVSGR